MLLPRHRRNLLVASAALTLAGCVHPIVRVPGPGPSAGKESCLAVADQGSRTEPGEGETQSVGQGNLRVGRALSNGYVFDHFDFSYRVIGPGGADARVKEGASRGSSQAYLNIRWYYDAYSKVEFSWKIYAAGPCGGTP